jgi:tetratricopeptide (TPR) repeat protein
MDWLEGKQIAFTGKLASMTRTEAARLISAHGGEFVSTVNRQTSILVVGQQSWPLRDDGQLTIRLKKAQQFLQDGHAIAIVNEEEFLHRLGLEDGSTGVHRRYTLAQLADLLQVPAGRCRAWMQAGLIAPVERIHGMCYFDFRQVAGAKALSELTRSGISSERIRRSLEQLKVWLADADQPLDQLAFIEKNGKLLIRLEEGLVEPSGQMCFDFGDGQATVPLQPASAEQWFQTGCQHEEGGFLEEAVHAYRQALLLGGPDADACFNLANVHYSMGDCVQASERYRQVVEIDPSRAEAWNNWGVVLVDLKQLDEAMSAFRKAIAADHADAHFNLADLLERMGEPAEAREHWRAYLRYDLQGRWSKYARGRVMRF